MAEWLLAHDGKLSWYALLTSFAVLAIVESFRPRQPLRFGPATRWVTNAVLSASGSLLVALIVPVGALSAALLAEQRGWGVLNLVHFPAWLTCLIGAIALDLTNYGQHRLVHKLPLLWRFHQVHHSDLDVDCATALRHHPVEILFSTCVAGGAVLLFGIPPGVVIVMVALFIASSVLNHANIAVSDPVDRWLRRIVVTPDMHRTHHSANVTESNRNFTTLLPWWDHLFGTYQSAPRLGYAGMQIGITSATTASDVTLGNLLLMPFRRARPAIVAKAA